MKKLLLLAAGVALARWLNRAEKDALARHSTLPRLHPDPPPVPRRAEVVRQGTGW